MEKYFSQYYYFLRQIRQDKITDCELGSIFFVSIKCSFIPVIQLPNNKRKERKQSLYLLMHDLSRNEQLFGNSRGLSDYICFSEWVCVAVLSEAEVV